MVAGAFFGSAFLGFLFSLFFGLLSPIRIASFCMKVTVLYNKTCHLSPTLLIVNVAAEVILYRLALFRSFISAAPAFDREVRLIA